MLAKVIAHGADRDEALRRLDAALARRPRCSGSDTNVGFLRALLADDDVRAARLDTGLVGRRVGDWPRRSCPPTCSARPAAHALLELEPAGAVVDPFDVPGGWRVGEPAWASRRMVVSGHEPVTVRIRGRAAAAEIVVGDADPVSASTARHAAQGASDLRTPRTGAPGATPATATDGHALARPRRRSLGHPRAGAAGGRRRPPAPDDGGPVLLADARHGDRRRGRRGAAGQRRPDGWSSSRR